MATGVGVVVGLYNIFVEVLFLSRLLVCLFFFFFSSRRRHTRSKRDWSSDVCSSDLGIIAFKMFPHLANSDHAYLALVKELIPTGLKGLLLAGMAAALMSHVSAVLNSSSTIITIDLYKKLMKREVTEHQQVYFGRWSGVAVLAASIGFAIYFTTTNTTLFEKIQTVFFFIAPPFAVIFTLGVLWKRANAIAALLTILIGFLFSGALFQFKLLGQYNTFNHRALAAWIVCMAVMITTSLLTAPPPKEKTE